MKVLMCVCVCVVPETITVILACFLRPGTEGTNATHTYSPASPRFADSRVRTPF